MVKTVGFTRSVDPGTEPPVIKFCQAYASKFTPLFIGWCVVGWVMTHRRMKQLTGEYQSLLPEDAEALAVREGYGVPNFGVPHCRYEQTETGFKVTINSGPQMNGCIISLLLLGVPGVIFFLITFSWTSFDILVMLTITAAYYFLYNEPHRIELTRDTVIINGVPLELKFLARFMVLQRGRHSKLQYQYGGQHYGFSGDWDAMAATETASALNNHLDWYKQEALRAPRPVNPQRTKAQDELRKRQRPDKY